MSGRGSENRQKTQSVLVRLTEAEYRLLTHLAELEQASRAEFLRRRIERPASPTPEAPQYLADTDRIVLANATRSMGHLAGLMKKAVLEGGKLGLVSRTQDLLDAHHRDLQALQAKIRLILDRLK